MIGAGYTNNGTTSLVDNRVEHEVTIAPKEQDTIVSIVASPSKKTTPSKPLRLCSKVRTCNRDKTKKKRGDKSNKDKTQKPKDQYEVRSIAVLITVTIGFCNLPPSEGSRSLKTARPLKQESVYSDQVVAK